MLPGTWRRRCGPVAGVTAGPGTDVRRFACTACGRCCDRGPEMELSEATALADRLVTSLIFKAHSLPLDERGERAARWWHKQGSRLPLRAALAERRRHLALFASRRRSDRRNDREIHLEISAIVDDYDDGRCPVLVGERCAIHDRRPLTCRTVPLHYSRPASVLQGQVDRFTATPGYRCDTVSGPVILDANRIVSAELQHDRERAIAMASADRGWKARILAVIDDAPAAERAGLPSFDAIVANADDGYATSLPMIVGWRVAEACGIIDPAELKRLCGQQLALIRTEIARTPAARGLQALIPIYAAGAAGSIREVAAHAGSPAGRG